MHAIGISFRATRRIAVALLILLVSSGSLYRTDAAAFSSKRILATAIGHPEENVAHQPLCSLGVTLGQTIRINVVNSPDPHSSAAPQAITVEMCFHDSNGALILDRQKRPLQKTVTIEPHSGDFIDLNGNLVAGPGNRIVIIPCFRVLRISDGSLAIPTVEMFNNLIKTTVVLNPGIARGFDPQPDPPAPQQQAFGLVGLTPGVTARLYVINAENPTATDAPEPVTVELEFHDARGNDFFDRTGQQSRRVISLNPREAQFLELNGNDVSAPGARVGIIPCIKVLRGSSHSLVVPTFEMYVNFTQQTLLVGNFVSDPHTPQ